MRPGGARKKAVKSPARKVSSQKPPPPSPASFSLPFFANLLPDDLACHPPAARARMAASMWFLARQRRRGKINLRVFNPSLAEDGWTLDHTVLQIVNDDMPFLLNSVTGELQRRGLTVHLSIHPIMFVRRDASGRLRDLKGGKTEAESFIHIHFDRTTGQQEMDDIARTIRQILAEVRAAVTDRAAMQKRVRDIIKAIPGLRGAGLPGGEIDETGQFLAWLNHDNFTFLGYRTLDLARKREDLRWKTVPGSNLGILRDEKERVFGNLRDLKTQPPEVRRLLRQKRLIIITKTNKRARVHRTVPMDAVFVQRFDARGRVIGEHMFVGLFASAAYMQSSLSIPYLRRKIDHVLASADFDPDSYNGRALIHVLNNYPRDELFQVDADELYRHAIGIVQLQERARVALFLRKDPFGRFVTCLIYVPRELYDTRLRKKLQAHLENAFAGTTTNLNTRIDDSPLARVFMTVGIKPDRPWPDGVQLEKELRALSRSWTERLQGKLRAEFGEDRMLHLFKRYGEAFPAAYSDAISAAGAVRDIKALERVLAEKRFIVDLSEIDGKGLLRLKLYQPGHPLVLSHILPLIENMGLNARKMGGPFEIAPCDGCEKIYIHEFTCRLNEQVLADFARIKPLFEKAFIRLFAGDVENDIFNALTLGAGLAWREITVLRALARYLRQLRIPYDQDMMAKTLLAHPQTARDLAALFLTRHDPGLKGDRVKAMARIEAKIETALDAITAIEEDRIIRRYLNLVRASLRTNYFRPGGPKEYLAIKFDSRAIDFMPLPKPLYEIFVCSPRVEAVHLRGGKVARGGIRWSDRRDDFRNEILGLMKAQMVKNAVIVPVGSKGGFIVKQPPKEPGRLGAEGIACYKLLIRGLLDLTDNRMNGRIVPPPHVVRHDGDDPYLVVAADKGTAAFSDIANAISQEYGFWLDDAFASGGSAGYDHKKMGITARGVWEGVKRHFRELGLNTQTTDFTCIGVGGMAGDVFGNGMLLSKHIRLIGAFDHSHIFCDPDPVAAKSHAERQRLFKIPHCSWADYNPAIISRGGGVFSRGAKSLRLTPEIRKAFGINADALTPNELIQALLRARVDLLYFGGIGTYIKANDESHADVKDRANDAVRIDGREIGARVTGEGANLGMTQHGRVEYAQSGGRLNTDAIDNSAGVATSDREVNIKILLHNPVMKGKLTLPARNKLLAGMTGEVAALVLRDNYRQTQAISVAEARAANLLPFHARSIRFLEKSGLLNRAIEYLPDETELAERQRMGHGLTRPELAIMLSYAKIWLYEQLLSSDLPDDPFLHKDLLYYFPERLKKKFAFEMSHHQLRREIVATRLTNSLINRVGSHFIFTVADQTGRGAADIARGYHLVRAAFGLHALWKEIESLDYRVPAKAQTDMFLIITRMMDYVLPWFLMQDEVPVKLAPAIERYRAGVERVAAWFAKNPDAVSAAAEKTGQDLALQGVPKPLARRLAILPLLSIAPDLTRLAGASGCAIEEAAAVFFGLGERLHLEWLRERIAFLSGPETPWQHEAIMALLGDLLDNQRALTRNVIGLKTAMKGKPCVMEDLLSSWMKKNTHRLERYETLIEEIRAAGNLDIAMLTLASHQLSALVK